MRLRKENSIVYKRKIYKLMPKVRYNIFDSSFAHEKCSVAGQISQNIEWNRGAFDPNLDTFYTNEFTASKNIDLRRSYAWMTESAEFIPHLYQELRRYINNFKYIFTSDSYLLEQYPEKCKFSPSGGIWVNGTNGLGEIKLYNKTKFCSLVAGLKMMCQRHQMRVTLAELLHRKVDIMGDLVGRNIPIIESLEQYHYSIIVENHDDKNYFTEKTLNCFATGTIPVCISAHNLGEWFNMDGVIQFSTVDECMSIIHKLTPDYYYTKLDAVKDNFQKCQKFRIIEDFIYENYLKDEVND